MPTRVLLVEDSDVYRASLELLLPHEGDLEVVAAVATGAEAVARIGTAAADVALVDLRLPGMDGVETIAALRAAAPGLAIVVLTAEASDAERAAAEHAGAQAVVSKERPLRELAAAVHEAAAARRPS